MPNSALPHSELAALLLFASAMAFTPGPNTSLSAALAAQGGLRHALPFVLAVPVGWGLMLAACAMGLGSLIGAAPALRGLIKALGLAYMLWLAWRLWRSSAPQAAGSNPPLRVGFAQGVGLQFVNIKAWTNALLINAGWVTVAQPWWPRLLWVLPIMMAYGLVSNLTYALLGAALRKHLAQGQRLRIFNGVMALALVVTALWMLQL